MHKVIVMGITFDSTNNSPVVILKDANNERILPIWIGPFEANSILMELEGIKTPRPMTHDLAKRIIHSLGAKVESVIINDIKDNTFYAQINLVTDGSTTAIDSRPSDAIAIAIRTSSPIYVAAIGHITKDNQETKERVKEFINQLKPEDFINAEDDK